MSNILSRDTRTLCSGTAKACGYALDFDQDRAQRRPNTITYLVLVHVIVNALK